MKFAGDSIVSPDFEAARTGFDRRVMLDVFRRHLTPGRDPAMTIESCRLSRYRHRQARRAIFLYELDVVERHTGQRQTLWCSALYNADKPAVKMYERLAGRLAIDQLPRYWRRIVPLACVAETDMLLQAFPVDRRLTGLADLVSGPPPALAEALRVTTGPGTWRCVKWRIQPARYRPFQSATLRAESVWRRASDTSERKALTYVKVFRDETGRRAALHKLMAIERALEGSMVGTPAVLAELPEQCALAFMEARGTPLREQILTGDTHGAGDAARALSVLHASDAPTLTLRDNAAVLARLSKAAGIMARAASSLGASGGALLERIRGCPPAFTPRPVHMDMKPEHILLRAGGAVLIDLDSAQLGDPAYDLAMLLARLQLMRHEDGAAVTTIHVAQQRVLDSYFAGAPRARLARLNYWYAVSAIKVALYCVQHRSDRWRARAARHLNLAHLALDGREHCWAMEV